MSLIQKILGLEPTRPTMQAGPLQDVAWWGNVGGTAAGVSVGPDTALKLSTVWACVGLLGDTVASLPLVVYRQTADGKERAPTHPLYEILHDQPNQQQTAFDFWKMMMTHLLLRGNAYARIVPGARGFVDQLMPLHPDAVQVEALSNGRLRFRVQTVDQGEKVYTQDEIFYLRGLSLDGVKGVSVITYARESMGLGLAAEGYGARFFGNDSRPGGILRTDKRLTPEAGKKLKQSWEAAHAGANQHRVAVLEEGLEWQQTGIAPEDAQFLETREFQAEDICRWFRVPPHMVGLTSKQTSWGTGIEQMSIGFVTYSLMPTLISIRQAIARDLIIAPQTYFAEFVVEGLLRGNIADRYSAYAIAVQWGWLNRNEVRALENMNARPGLDAYLTPLNMTTDGSQAAADAAPVFAREHSQNVHYRMLAEEAAGRLIRKERAAITRIYEKMPLTSLPDEAREAAFGMAVSDFYLSHVDLVAQTLRVPLSTAKDYCDRQAAAIVAVGRWPENLDLDMVAYLAQLAIGVEQ